jgi:hypothetical protein
MFPYDDIPSSQRWPSNASPDIDLLEIMGPAKFTVARDAKIASAGSCFAQRLAEQLQSFDLAHMNAGRESPYATEYGNIYSARQLKQLIFRCTGAFTPQESVWETRDGRYVDPFRPFVHHPGLERAEDIEASRVEHLRRVRSMFTDVDVFLFTVGLTEVWYDVRDGAVFPALPGKHFGDFDPTRFAHKNLDVNENIGDLEVFLRILFGMNPKVKVILSVSPVAIAATMNPMHVVRASMLTKSVLKVAAEMVAAAHPAVDYFPAYDVVMQSFGTTMFSADRRHVAADVPERVSSAFVRRYYGGSAVPSQPRAGGGLFGECDEDRLLRSISIDRPKASRTSLDVGVPVTFPKPIIFIGDSSTLVFDQALFVSPKTGERYLGVGVHCPGLGAFGFTQPDGKLNAHVVQKLVAAKVLHENLRGYDVLAETRAFGRPVSERDVPPIVLFCGSHDLVRLWHLCGERFVDLPDAIRPPAYGPRSVDDCSFDEACRLADEAVAPLFGGIEIMRSFGISEIIVHAITPRGRDYGKQDFFHVPTIDRVFYGIYYTLNHALEMQCARGEIPFVDVAPDVVAVDGYRDELFTLDRTHLNSEAVVFTFERVTSVLEARV